jgi:hypothetical protein
MVGVGGCLGHGSLRLLYEKRAGEADPSDRYVLELYRHFRGRPERVLGGIGVNDQVVVGVGRPA